MIRNLKTFGVALAAVFALGAVVASGASAAQAYLTADGPLKDLTGVDTGAESLNRLTALNTNTHCKVGKYTITTVDSNEHPTTVIAHPTYEGCTTSALKLTTHVNMNGCYYELHLKETTASPADTYGVTATLICEKTKNPTVVITAPTGTCTVTITPEKGNDYNGLDVTDNTDGSLLLNGTATNIPINAAGAGCTETGEKTASLDANIKVTGDNSKDEATDIGISEEGESTTFIWGDRGGTHITP